VDGIIRGSMSWIRGEKETGNIIFKISIVPGDEYIRFVKHPTNEREKVDYKIELNSSPCFFGGKRWWFICSCQRRVGALYFRYGDKYFGCRHCKNLTYESCKENHRFDRLFRELGMTPKKGKLYVKTI